MAQKPTQTKESVAETSLSLVAERVEQLKALFPEAVSEGKVDGINYQVVSLCQRTAVALTILTITRCHVDKTEFPANTNSYITDYSQTRRCKGWRIADLEQFADRRNWQTHYQSL